MRHFAEGRDPHSAEDGNVISDINKSVGFVYTGLIVSGGRGMQINA